MSYAHEITNRLGRNLSRLVLATAMLVAGIGIGAGVMTVLADHDDANNVIHACVHTQTGQVRIVEHPDECRTAGEGQSRNRRAAANGPEQLVEWNKQGPAGPRGPRGEPGLVWQGGWDSTVSYAAGDAVSYQGSSYVAVAASTGEAPDNGSNWELLASQGERGPQGESANLPVASCPEGETVAGFDENDELLCEPDAVGSPPVESCAWGEALVGFDENGNLVCKDVEILQLRDCSNVEIVAGADLSECDLRGADLSGMILSDVNQHTDLTGANLSGANLSGTGLIGADMRDANLTNADLTDASLELANLEGADLTGATLNGASWGATTCPDGSNSDDPDGDALTCENNLDT